jgi:hypothetical protein
MRNFDLSPLYRSAIGFDRLFNLLENNQGQSNGGYPPYNVELVDVRCITVAVAALCASEPPLFLKCSYRRSDSTFTSANLTGYGRNRRPANTLIVAEVSQARHDCHAG